MLSLFLFGSPQIRLDGRTIDDLTSAKSQALLYYLALQRRPQSRLRLAGLLWPERSDQEARLNLRQTLFLLRQALPGAIAATREQIGLNPDLPVEIDIHNFEAELKAGLAGDLEALRSAVERYKGEFLAGFYVDEAPDFGEWALLEQERLRTLALQAMSQLSTTYSERGETGFAIFYTGKLLALEPLREDSHRQMMRLLARDGKTQAALAQYERCRQLLASELGVEPSAETDELVRQIQSGAFAPAPASQPAEKASQPALLAEWGDAPAWIAMHGRESELRQLEEQILKKERRLVAVLGMGGQGKTTLAASFARTYQAEFEVLLWRSLLNAPLLDELVHNWLEVLAPDRAARIPQGLDNRLNLLFDLLGQRRCLLVLDNAESIMEGRRQAGIFRAGYEPYEQLLRRFALSRHQSCLLLTSREKPRQFSTLERRQGPVFSLALSGLGTGAGRAVLQEESLRGSEAELGALVHKYSGNPLALILVADMIRDLYRGDVRAFLAADTAIFENVQAVLAHQFERLTELEEQVLLWLAVEREPVTIPDLGERIRLAHTHTDLLVALRSLKRRSLVEERENGFTLQNVLMEFVTDRLVARSLAELLQGELETLARVPLLMAQARAYIRLAQERLLLQPVARQLAGQLGGSPAVARLKQILRDLPPSIRANSYAGGNLLNLLLALDVQESLDFSGTAVWGAFLRGKTLPAIDFHNADLSGAALTEYGGYVLTLAFSPDGTRLAGSTISGELRLWDVDSHRALRNFDGHRDFAGALCFSPDGRTLASGGGDSLACLWDVETGRRLRTFPALDNAVLTLAFAPDGSWLAGSSANRLTVWDPGSGAILFEREFPGGYVDALAVSHDGKTLAFSNRNHVLLWDIAQTLATGEGKCLHEFQGHQEAVRRLAFSADDRWIAASGDRVCVWDAASGELRHSLEVANGRIDGLAFHPHRDLLAGGSQDTIYLWQVATGKLLRAFHAHEELIVSLAFSPDGGILVSCSEDHTIRFWDLDGQNLHTLQEYVNMIHSVDVSADGRYLACGSDDHKVRLWDFQREALLAAWEGHQSRVHRAIFSPDGRLVAASSRDRLVRVWATPSGEERYQLPTAGVPYHALSWSPDARLLATGDRAGVLAIWEADRGHRLHTFRHESRVNTVAFHPGGRQIAAGCADEKIYIWDIDDGSCLNVLACHENEVWALAYTQDGRTLFSGGDDYTVRVWDPLRGACLHVLDAHSGWVQTLALNRAGNLLASGSQDQTIAVWELSGLARGEAPRLARRLLGHKARVTSVCFTPDERLIVSSSLDETIRLWRAADGECLQVWTIPGPYAGMDISGVSGLTAAQRRSLVALGADEG